MVIDKVCLIAKEKYCWAFFEASLFYLSVLLGVIRSIVIEKSIIF